MHFLRWVREPLVQFLLIGAVLFIAFDLRGGGARGGQRIVVTPGQVDAVAAGFSRTWNRPPNEQELKAQLDEYVREEIAVREAAALGLDRDDTVIRRRLRQKFEFAAEDALDATPATDAELQAFLDSHPDTYRREPRLSLRQVHLGPQRGSALQNDARQLLLRLQAGGPDADTRGLGDSRLLPASLENTALGEVARMFGNEFAGALLKAEPGSWVGPLRSSYGLHVVIVDRRDGGQLPALADVRPLVERDFLADRRKRQIEAMYTKLLARYPVVIERRSPAASASVPAR
jgi:PPIC-type PPIASE domain